MSRGTFLTAIELAGRLFFLGLVLFLLAIGGPGCTPQELPVVTPFATSVSGELAQKQLFAVPGYFETNGIPVCPHCRKPTQRGGGMSTATCAYYPPIYDHNGVNTNPDRNTITSSYDCYECGNNYTVYGNSHDGYQYGEWYTVSAEW